MKKYSKPLDLSSRNSLSVLINRIKPKSLVLEFGPAFGRMTKYLKENLNCKVFAVELDEEAANISKQFTEKLVVNDIENYKWEKEFGDIKFDYIIFADVLEHLYNPKKVLKEVRNFLKDSGSILISIPNIAHNAIVMGLLKNEFNYSPEGLLDDTHIRFFTKKTFANLLENLNYYIKYETAIYISPEDTELGYQYNEFPPEIFNFLKKLEWGEHYQLVYEIVKYPIDNSIKDYSDKYQKNYRYFCQLFVNKYGKCNDKDGIIIYLKLKEKNKLYFKLNGEVLNSIRLDPINECAVVKILSINSDATIVFKNSNAEIIKDNTFYFSTDTPHMYFNVQGAVSHVEFEIELVAIGKDALKLIIENKNSKLKKKSKEITILQKEIENKTSKLEEKSIKCKIYEVQLKRLKNEK